MKNLLYRVMLVLGMVITIIGCKKDAEKQIVENQLDNHYDKLKKLGFTSDIVDMGNYFRVQGDIIISKEELEKFNPDKNIPNKISQAYSEQ